MEELKKQLYTLYAITFVIIISLQLFLYSSPAGSFFDYFYLLAMVGVCIQCIRLIIHKYYVFGIFAAIPMIFGIITFIDKVWYRDLIAWADTAELINILHGLSIIIFAIVSFIYSIQLIKRKELRWGISLLVISVLVIIFLGITLFLSIVLQGLK